MAETYLFIWNALWLPCQFGDMRQPIFLLLFSQILTNVNWLQQIVIKRVLTRLVDTLARVTMVIHWTMTMYHALVSSHSYDIWPVYICACQMNNETPWHYLIEQSLTNCPHTCRSLTYVSSKCQSPFSIIIGICFSNWFIDTCVPQLHLDEETFL